MKLPALRSDVAKTGAIVLGTIVVGLFVVNRDWHREKAYAASMAGRGTYR